MLCGQSAFFGGSCVHSLRLLVILRWLLLPLLLLLLLCCNVNHLLLATRPKRQTLVSPCKVIFTRTCPKIQSLYGLYCTCTGSRNISLRTIIAIVVTVIVFIIIIIIIIVVVFARRSTRGGKSDQQVEFNQSECCSFVLS